VDGLTLLKQAEVAGLAVRADGSLLVVSGPRRLEPLAQMLLANKPRLLPLLRCGRCEANCGPLVLTYWTGWAEALCQRCVALVAAEYDRDDTWPPLPDAWFQITKEDS
jgi:hypothetical protein